MARTTAPDLAVCTALNTATDLTLILGDNLFCGPVREVSDAGGRDIVPHEAVFVLTTGGEAPVAYKDKSLRDELRALVTVYVRSDLNEFETGQALARDVWFALQHEALPGYMECQCLESEPRYTGADDTGHHRWSISLRLVREEAIA